MITAMLKRFIGNMRFSVHRLYILFKEGTKAPVSSVEFEFKFLQRDSNLVIAWEFNKTSCSTVGVYLALPFLVSIYIGIGTPYWKRVTRHVKNKNTAQYGFIGDIDKASLMWAHGFDGGKIFKFSIYELLFGGTKATAEELIDVVATERRILLKGGASSYIRVTVAKIKQICYIKRFFERTSWRYKYLARVDFIRGESVDLPADLKTRIFLSDVDNNYENVTEQTLTDINLYLIK